MNDTQRKAEAVTQAIRGNVRQSTCWECNPAHKSLKLDEKVIECPECKEDYYKGKKI